MKRLLNFILAIFAIIALASCTKESKDTTYEFRYLVSDIENVDVDVILFEYSSNDERVGTNSISDLRHGHTATFTASSMAVKVKVYITMKYYNSSESNKWIQQVFYLEPESNIIITLSDDTIIGNKEP